MGDSGFLLDTNVISETRQKRPEPRVIAFLASLRHDLVWLSVLTLGELRKGAISKLRTDKKKGHELARWVESVEASYSQRLLSVDAAVASVWAKLEAARPRPVVDTLIAATALVHELTLVTRDVREVHDTGASIVNPWDPGS